MHPTHFGGGIAQETTQKVNEKIQNEEIRVYESQSSHFK